MNRNILSVMSFQYRCLALQGSVSSRNFLAAVWKGSRCLISIVVTIALTIPPRPVFAFGILDSTFHVEAQVGLDDPTRKLIQSFPKEIREQVLGVLTTALPLIKTDVNEYIDKINSLLTEQIANVQCAGGGLAKGVMDQLARTIGVSPKPIQDLQGDWSKTVHNFKISSKPEEYANRTLTSPTEQPSLVVKCKSLPWQYGLVNLRTKGFVALLFGHALIVVV